LVSYALVQGKAAYGYAKVAETVGGGTVYNVYRPASANNPVSGTPLATIPAIFSQDANLSFSHPANYEKESWFGAFDLTQAEVGDYLVGQQGTFFVASTAPQSPFSAPRCVLCNIVINVLRQPEDAVGAVGPLSYGGDVSSNEVMIMQGWPAGVLETKRATRGATNLPGDEDMAWFDVYLPLYAGTLITQNDILVDQTGRRYRVSGIELTTLGWRLHVVVTMT